MKYLLAIPLCLAATASAYAYEFTNADLCKAAISVEMMRETSTMKTRESGGVPIISYTRDDGDSFSYRCKIGGGMIVWSALLDGQWGRWRDSDEYGDSTITYVIANGVLTVRSSMTGSKTTFRAKDFN